MKHFITTAHGGRFYYGEKACPVDVLDVAHHLSHVARFSGATVRHYSVAQHACLALAIAEEMTDDAADLLAVLHHDDHEGFMGGDTPTPYQDWLEDKAGARILHTAKEEIDAHVLPQMGVSFPLSVATQKVVSLVDKLAFLTEASQLFYTKPSWLGEWETRFRLKPLAINIPWMTPEEARERFLSNHSRLTGGTA